MPGQVIEQPSFGGVDSRSSPLAEPLDRSLRCRNFVPDQAGFLRLRYGYSTVSMSTVSASAIHSMVDYAKWDGTRFVIFQQGTALKQLALATGTVLTITPAPSSSGRFSVFFANNRAHFGNGVDNNWFYDGTTKRDIGIRAPTSAEAASVAIADGVQQATNFTVSNNTAGGSFGTTTKLGYLFYVAYFDTSLNERGPARAYSGRLTVANGTTNSFDFTGLENLANANLVKLFPRTNDGGQPAYFCTAAAAVSNTTVSRSSNVVTVSATSHGNATNAIVILAGVTDASFNDIFKVTGVPDANSYTFAQTGPNASSSGGTTARLVSASNSATTASITGTGTATSITANTDRGINATSVGGAQPGYQLYMAFYNPTTGHVGDRIAIGPRYGPTKKENILLSGLPDLSAVNTEWAKLIGRTGDGVEVPYALADSGGNWIYAGNTATTLTITDPLIDGGAELPTRNSVPAPMDKFARAGDFIYGTPPNSPQVFRSGSASDERTGDFVGRPEQSWAADDVETFPTVQSVTCLGEYDSEVWVFTLNDGAILSEIAGRGWSWFGPFNLGCAGQRAFTKTPYGPFWVTGEKQLATASPGGPIVISDEYEKALLVNIGAAYLSTTEIVHLRDASKGIDKLTIKCRDSSGNPFEVYHDFRLRDGRSQLGQGYDAVRVGALASDYVIAQVRDANGVKRIFAGATDGRIYQMEDGDNDGGTEFDADYIALVSFGPERPSLPHIEWQGDANVVVSVGKNLKTSLSTTAEFPFEDITGGVGGAQAVPGGEDDFQYRSALPRSEVKQLYIRIQLTSHSADGSSALSDPPHVPVEDYGRVYLTRGVIGEARGH